MSNRAKYVTINLEDDLPTVDQALKRLAQEIIWARRDKIILMKVIHGFGSSGKGGKIRKAVRNELEVFKRRGMIKEYITGEKLSIFDASTRLAIDKYREFRSDSDIERHNNGITVLVF